MFNFVRIQVNWDDATNDYYATKAILSLYQGILSFCLLPLDGMDGWLISFYSIENQSLWLVDLPLVITNINQELSSILRLLSAGK